MTAADIAPERSAPEGVAPPAVSVIVVSYNTREMTLDCLASIYAETRERPFELIVVDNASTDGSADAVAARFPDATLIRSDENLGFARANNLAAERAAAPRLLLLNPDTVVLRGAVDRLVAFADARPDAGVWGGRTVFADGSLNPNSVWREMSLWNLACRAVGLTALFPRSPVFNTEVYGGWARDSERAVDIVQGSFLLIDRALWDRLGGFDTDFVMYGEEADLCRRARALGAAPRMTPEAEIIHYGGASQTVRADRMIRLMRAKITLIRKHWRWPARPLGVWLFALWPWSRRAATGLAQALGRRADSHAVWDEVWRRRGEWTPGYPRRGRQSPAG